MSNQFHRFAVPTNTLRYKTTNITKYLSSSHSVANVPFLYSCCMPFVLTSACNKGHFIEFQWSVLASLGVHSLSVLLGGGVVVILIIAETRYLTPPLALRSVILATTQCVKWFLIRLSLHNQINCWFYCNMQSMLFK